MYITTATTTVLLLLLQLTCTESWDGNANKNGRSASMKQPIEYWLPVTSSSSQSLPWQCSYDNAYITVNVFTHNNIRKDTKIRSCQAVLPCETKKNVIGKCSVFYKTACKDFFYKSFTRLIFKTLQRARLENKWIRSPNRTITAFWCLYRHFQPPNHARGQ